MSNFYWGRNKKKNSRTFQPIDRVGTAKIECTTVTRHPPQNLYATHHREKNLTSETLEKVVFLYIKGF